VIEITAEALEKVKNRFEVLNNELSMGCDNFLKPLDVIDFKQVPVRRVVFR